MHVDTRIADRSWGHESVNQLMVSRKKDKKQEKDQSVHKRPKIKHKSSENKLIKCCSDIPQPWTAVTWQKWPSDRSGTVLWLKILMWCHLLLLNFFQLSVSVWTKVMENYDSTARVTAWDTSAVSHVWPTADEQMIAHKCHDHCRRDCSGCVQ